MATLVGIDMVDMDTLPDMDMDLDIITLVRDLLSPMALRM